MAAAVYACKWILAVPHTMPRSGSLRPALASGIAQIRLGWLCESPYRPPWSRCLTVHFSYEIVPCRTPAFILPIIAPICEMSTHGPSYSQMEYSDHHFYLRPRQAGVDVVAASDLSMLFHFVGCDIPIVALRNRCASLDAAVGLRGSGADRSADQVPLSASRSHRGPARGAHRQRWKEATNSMGSCWDFSLMI
jgi:hypothetical protein